MKIEDLYEKLSKRFGFDKIPNYFNGHSNYVVRPTIGYAKVRVGDYGSDVDDYSKRTLSDTYSSIVAISKHFVTKPLYKITAVKDSDGEKISVITTNDHTCAVYNDVYHEMLKDIHERHITFTDETFKKYDSDKIISFKAAKDLKIGDIIPCSEEKMPILHHFCDSSAKITAVEEIDNSEGRYVYDIEVESGRHVYYANGILVHNSQFINLSPITKTKCREFGISESTRFSELPENVRKAVVDDAYHILDIVNANVEKLINTNCHTSQGNVVHYSLEYIAAEGFYFKPKHYIVHKIIEDDLPCNKFKYSGISVKKAEIPAEMKSFLKEVYEHTMTDEWHESDYLKKVEEAFNKYNTLDWGQLAFYKKYRTKKEAVSMTESEKGAGAHARAVNIYNGLLKELNLGGKYPEISIGDEFRYSYVLPTNRYGVNVIGFKGEFPREFRDIFTPDYTTMFEKIFTKSLENYINIMGYEKIDPSKRTEDPSFDIF
jgi:hypothetical protein